MRFFVRFILLAIGFSLFTYGLLQWANDEFELTGLLPFTDGYRTQGLHYLMLGLAMIPPSLWEIFNLERKASSAYATPPAHSAQSPKTAQPTDEPASSVSPTSQANPTSPEEGSNANV